MKKKIATGLRRIAQWLDPQKGEITGYARKVVEFVPYTGIDIYRKLLLAGNDGEASNLKHSMRVLTEALVEAGIHDKLCFNKNLRIEHNFGTSERVINGITCKPGGATVVLELKGSWS